MQRMDLDVSVLPGSRAPRAGIRLLLRRSSGGAVHGKLGKDVMGHGESAELSLMGSVFHRRIDVT
jgi:hypothetical protein